MSLTFDLFILKKSLEIFLFTKMQVNLIIIRPTAQAVVALTFAYYVLQPMFDTCDPPLMALKLLAAICISKYISLEENTQHNLYILEPA